jgi:hypothetical protein
VDMDMHRTPLVADAAECVSKANAAKWRRRPQG